MMQYNTYIPMVFLSVKKLKQDIPLITSNLICGITYVIIFIPKTLICRLINSIDFFFSFSFRNPGLRFSTNGSNSYRQRIRCYSTGCDRGFGFVVSCQRNQTGYALSVSGHFENTSYKFTFISGHELIYDKQKLFDDKFNVADSINIS